MTTARRHVVDLRLRWADLEEVYKDIVRIPECDRGELRTGKIHKFKVGKRSAYFILRGRSPSDNGFIILDEISRERLGLKEAKSGERYQFTIVEAGFWGELLWSLNAVDPAYRIAARLGVLSFVLGLIALLPIQDVLAFVWRLIKSGICYLFGST